MNVDSSTQIAQAFQTSKGDLLDAASGLSEQEANQKPAAGGWSVRECVEHVVMVEERFLGRLQGAERLETPRVDKEKEAQLTSTSRNRVSRFDAPEAVQPTGRFQTLEEAFQAFDAVRSRLMQFAEEHSDHLYHLTLAHPRFGTMNGVEVLMLLAAHAHRHAEQMRETKMSLQTA